jgi:hypothetical protein
MVWHQMGKPSQELNLLIIFFQAVLTVSLCMWVQDSWAQCMNDQDCKLGRICSKGECQAPLPVEPVQIPDNKKKKPNFSAGEKMAFDWSQHRGCGILGANLGAFAKQINLLQQSGHPVVDQYHQAEIALLRQVFGVSPGFSFFDDSQSPNAFATPSPVVPGGIDGSVVFGATLIQNEVSKFGQNTAGAAIAGIMAHEFAHIVQFKNGLGTGPVPPRELQADCLAGWYMGVKQVTLWGPQGQKIAIEGLFASLFEKGSDNWSNPNWHGTQQQRATMGMTGWYLALSGQLNPQTAFQQCRQAVGF